MHFVERVLGVSPDGGTGSTELMLIAAVVIVAFVVSMAFAARNRIMPDRE